MTHRPVLAAAAELAADYLDELPSRRVRPEAGLAEMRAALAGPLPEEGSAAEEVLTDLDRHARPGLMANAGPRFFGFVIGGALPVAVAADWLTAAWDQNAGLFVLSPAEAVAEETAAGWVLELLGLPSTASVGFVTGGQMANFTCLAAARGEVLRRVGWDVDLQGLAGAPRLRVLAGEEVHVTVLRALRYLGMGTACVETVGPDDQGRLRPDALRAALARIADDDPRTPTIVCAQAGNVNSGAIDPLDEIADAVSGPGAPLADTWLHVDGAFGLWAAVSPARRGMLAGVERADSWAVDAHKWLNVPQDSGLAIVAHPAAHRAAISTTAEYLIKSTSDERDPVDWTPEFSRRGRGFAVYAALRHLGRSGMREIVERCCAMAGRIADRLAASPHAVVLNRVELNQALIRFLPDSPLAPLAPDPAADELTRRVIARVQREGTCWLGGTTWHGVGAMRVSVSNWRTDEEAADRSAEAILECLEQELAAAS